MATQMPRVSIVCSCMTASDGTHLLRGVDILKPVNLHRRAHQNTLENWAPVQILMANWLRSAS